MHSLSGSSVSELIAYDLADPWCYLGEVMSLRLCLQSWWRNRPQTNAVQWQSLLDLTRYVNYKNNTYWPAENSLLIDEVLLQDVKFGVHCAVSAGTIFGRIFFFWDHEFVPLFYTYSDTIFFNTSNNLCIALFSVTRISRESWPPRSPDMNLCGFYLCYMLRDKAFVINCCTDDDLEGGEGGNHAEYGVMSYTSRNITCNKFVCEIWCISVNQRKPFSYSSLNMASSNLTWTAIQWAKMREFQLRQFERVANFPKLFCVIYLCSNVWLESCVPRCEVLGKCTCGHRFSMSWYIGVRFLLYGSCDLKSMFHCYFLALFVKAKICCIPILLNSFTLLFVSVWCLL